MLGSIVSLRIRIVHDCHRGSKLAKRSLRQPALAGRQGRSVATTAAAAHSLLFGRPLSAESRQTSIGMINVMVDLIAFCTGLGGKDREQNNATTPIWKPVDIMKDFRWRPYKPQISFTATGFDVKFQRRQAWGG